MGVSTGLAGCFGGGNDNSNNQQTESSGGPSTPTGTPLGADAQLSLRQIDAPPEAEIQQEYTFRIHVENSGGQPGVYTAPVTVRRSGESNYQQVTEALTYVEPGETQAADISIPAFTGTGSANIRIESPQNQWRVNIVGPELAYDESFDIPDGPTISVRRIELTSNNGGVGPNGQEVSSPTGQQYVFAYIEVQNSSAGDDWTPEPESFGLKYQNSDSSVTYFAASGRYRRQVISSGTTYQGWLPYLVPESVSRSDVAIEYTQSASNVVAEWRSPNDADSSGSSSTAGGSTSTSSQQG
jgi:hypothetical protein